MTFEKGWINRQFAKLERDAQNWPEWLRRETDPRTNSVSTNESESTLGAKTENPPVKHFVSGGR